MPSAGRLGTTELIRQVGLFKDLNDDLLSELAAVALVRTVEPGTSVFREAEPMPPFFHALTSGTLQILKRAYSGKETSIRLVEAGEIFAWAALLDGKPAPATALAMTRSCVLLLPQQATMALMTREPTLALRLLVTLAERLRELHEQFHDVVSERARTRIARLILRHRPPEGLREDLQLPHQVLSRMAGIAYEECVRIIGEWTHGPRPLLAYRRGGRMTILEPVLLEQIAEGLERPPDVLGVD